MKRVLSFFTFLRDFPFGFDHVFNVSTVTVVKIPNVLKKNVFLFRYEKVQTLRCIHFVSLA